MVTPIIKYPLDLTGINPANLVLDEPHVINSSADRAFVPNHGPFYTRGLVVRMRGTGQVLQPHTDYKATQLFVDATLRTGMEVCSVIVAEPHIVGEVSIDYQTVGGDYSSSVYAIEQMIGSLELDNRPVVWGGLLGKPEYFPPAPHLHDIGDLYGFEYLVVALEGIRKAILLGDVAAMDELYRYVDMQDQAIWNKVNEIDGSLDSHLEDFNNPHRVTKGQIGLGQVSNYPVAQASDLLGAGSATAYITPAQVRLMIDEHANLRNNPHQVTKSQIGLELVQNFAVATWADVLAEANDKYLTPDMMVAYVNYAIENQPEPAVPPTARFSYTGATTVANNGTHTLTFADISTPGSAAINSWLWNFGDGTTSTLQAPPAKTYNFTVGSSGGSQTYTVSLTVTDANNISKTYTQDITLVKSALSLNPPTANYTVSGTFTATDPAQPQLTFADTSVAGTGTINKWEWDFGDGSVSAAQNPSKTYNLTVGQTKTYNITLKVTDTNGLSATKLGTVTVSRVTSVVEPNVDIQIVYNSPQSVVDPERHYLDFRDASTPGSAAIVEWYWEIHSLTATGVPETRTFTTKNTGTIEFNIPVGTYSGSAKLRVKDANNIFKETIRGFDLTKTPKPVVGPTANFTYSGTLTTTSPTNPSITVTDTTVPGDAPIIRYDWTWDDGSFATGSGQVSHTYNLPTLDVDRTFYVGLMVTDSNGQTASKIIPITLRKNSPAANQPPVAKFTSSVSGRTVAFTSQSTDADGSIVSHSWDFGDGTTSTQVNPSKTYPNTTQSYSVTLTVTDNNGASGYITKSVSIVKQNTAPIASWTVASQSNLSVNFNNTSSDPDGDALTYLWDFGDGTTSTAKNPSKTYSDAGTYSVSMTAKDTSNATNTASGNVTVTKPNNAPSANFTAAPNGLTVAFTDTSTDSDGTLASWSWDFGNGTTSTVRNPSCTYAAAGTYTVSLTVTDNLGAPSTKSYSITVSQPNRPPVADFAGPFTVLLGQANMFANTSTDPDGDALSAVWDWGDGTANTYTFNANKTYVNIGTYQVTLTVSDGRGGTNSVTKPVNVIYGSGGGAGCVVTNAILYNGATAETFARDDMLLSTDPYANETDYQRILLADTVVQPCVRIVLSNGATLECSTSAPIPTQDSNYVLAPNLMGEAVPYATREAIDAWVAAGDTDPASIPFEWVEVVDVVSLGDQYVRHIFAAQKNFWVSMNGIGFILHHNLKNNEPIP